MQAIRRLLIAVVPGKATTFARGAGMAGAAGLVVARVE
jgi:hypothetical protein